MPNHNPTVHNYLCSSVCFVPDVAADTVPFGPDPVTPFAHIDPFPSTFDLSPPFAIHAWVRWQKFASIRSRIISTPAKGAGVTTAFTLGLFGDDVFYGTTRNALRVGMGVDGAALTSTKVSSEPILRDFEWVHIVGQIKSGAIEIYINGCLIDVIDHVAVDFSLADNTAGGGTNTTGLVVGWDPNLDGPMDGDIASLAIINRALEEEEIETLAMGTTSLTSTRSFLKSSLIAWWKMGDGDPDDISTLLDSVGTNHLITVNPDELRIRDNVPRERPRNHQYLHVATGCDELKLEPNAIGCSFLWDSFAVLDHPNSVPRNWFGDKQLTDQFERTMIAGRISVLRLAKNTTGDGMFMTNVPTDAVGDTLLFGNPGHPDPTEYCFETVVRNNSTTAGDVLYMGFIEDPHGWDLNSDPPTGVYLRLDSDNSLRIIVANDGSQSLSINWPFGIDSTEFYRLKLCFSYVPDITQGGGKLRAGLSVNDRLPFDVTVLSDHASYPIGNGNVFIGTQTDSAPFDVDIEWVNITFRGINSSANLAF